MPHDGSVWLAVVANRTALTNFTGLRKADGVLPIHGQAAIRAVSWGERMETCSMCGTPISGVECVGGYCGRCDKLIGDAAIEVRGD